MKYKKEYGSYKTDSCVYCGAPALFRNSLKLPVCKAHKDTKEYPEYKCPCGDWVDIKEGKYGVFGLCIKCGPKKLTDCILQKQEEPTQQKPKIDPTKYPLI